MSFDENNGKIKSKTKLFSLQNKIQEKLRQGPHLGNRDDVDVDDGDDDDYDDDDMIRQDLVHNSNDK